MGSEKSELFHLVRRPIEGGSIAPVFVAGGTLVLGETDKVTGAAVVISTPHHEAYGK